MMNNLHLYKILLQQHLTEMFYIECNLYLDIETPLDTVVCFYLRMITSKHNILTYEVVMYIFLLFTYGFM